MRNAAVFATLNGLAIAGLLVTSAPASAVPTERDVAGPCSGTGATYPNGGRALGGPGTMYGYPGGYGGWMGPGMMYGAEPNDPPPAERPANSASPTPDRPCPGPGSRGGYSGWMGPGMMYGYPGGYGGPMGPGMMYGYPGGYGGWMGPGMMYGYPGGYGPGYQRQAQPLNISVNDVRGYFERLLAAQGNPRLKVGNVKQKDADTVTVEIVTKDGSLVERYDVGTHTGFIRPED